MSLDQRQTQIEVGAGQTESRINREFVDLLRKWSTPVLVLLVVGAGLAWAWNYRQTQRQQKQSTAWRELAEARTAGLPEGLLKVADDHPSEDAVALEARLAAGDRLLNAGITGARPGVERDATTGAMKDSAKGVLSKAERTAMFEQASAQYDKVMAASSGRAAQAIFYVNAALGKAAALESLEKWSEAEAMYAAAASAAEKAGLEDQAARAKSLAGGLDAARRTVLPGKNEVRSVKLLERTITVPDPSGGAAVPPPGGTMPMPPESLTPPPPPAPAAPAAPATPASTAPAPAPTPAPAPAPAPTPAPGGGR